jgi:mannose-6-phosphate isomerase-like protein (cupin superfamily)
VTEPQPERVVVVRPGQGHHVGNVEFLARTTHTPRFNLGIVTVQPRRSGPGEHVHPDEDDSFYILEGELVFTVDGEEVVAGPGTFVLVPPGCRHDFTNRTEQIARFLNIHAPAGFDIRLES